MTPDDLIPDDLIPVGKAARLLGVHVATVHRWIQAGKLRGWKLVGRYRVSEAEARALNDPVRPTAAPPRPVTEAARKRIAAWTARTLKAFGIG